MDTHHHPTTPPPDGMKLVTINRTIQHPETKTPPIAPLSESDAKTIRRAALDISLVSGGYLCISLHLGRSIAIEFYPYTMRRYQGVAEVAWIHSERRRMVNDYKDARRRLS